MACASRAPRDDREVGRRPGCSSSCSWASGSRALIASLFLQRRSAVPYGQAMGPVTKSTQVRVSSRARTTDLPARGTGLVVAALALTVVAACSAEEETGVSTTQLDETTRLASTAASTAAGITAADITDAREGISAVGGDASTTTSVSIGLTANATFRAFTVCTGGGDVELDLAGTAQELSCDGQVREVAELVVPDAEAEAVCLDGANDTNGVWPSLKLMVPRSAVGRVARPDRVGL